MDQKPIIKIGQLNVIYNQGRSNEVHALKNISLDIFPGEYIIFFGPSGCGKSTLLYSIAGLERNTQGDIVVQEKNLGNMSQYDLEDYHQSTIGMIFQSYYLISSLSVAQNVCLPQVAMHGNKVERTSKALELLEKFGVGQQAHKLPSELSGGQQQRVAICRSLMNDPSILVADEPVGNLDSKSSQDVMDLLRYLNDEQKKTVILVTHDPSHLHHAHRIFYLRDGVVTGTKVNTPEERKTSVVTANAPTALIESLSHWARTLPTGGEGADPYAAAAAQHILADVLTSMSVEELGRIESKIQGILNGRPSEDRESLFSILHHAVKDGGIGMHKDRARKLAKELRSLALRAKKLANMDKEKKLAEVAIRVRTSLLAALGFHAGHAAVAAIDEAVRLRLQDTIDRAGVQKLLNRSLKHGGAGLSVREARAASLHLESLLPPSTHATH